MRAVVLRGAGHVDVCDVPDAGLTDSRSAVVRPSLSAICGSDLHPYHGVYRETGYSLGHEAVGEVVEVGADVRRFRVGDRVLLPSNIGCSDCDMCRRGMVIHCRAWGKSVYGLDSALAGCQAEAVSVPQADFNLWPLAEHVSDEVGLHLTDNLATAWYCARRGRVGPGDVVAVLGLGSVGLLAVLSAWTMGASRVFAVDPVAERRAAAGRFGAEAFTPEEAAQLVAEATAGAGADVVLDAMGSEETARLGLRLAGTPGRMCVVGVNEKEEMTFPWRLAFERAIEYHTGAVSILRELPVLLRLVEQRRIDPESMESLFTHRFDLEDAAAAYALFDSRTSGVIKVALVPSEGAA